MASPGTLTVTPRNLRATRFGTVRHATRTRAAPPLASSVRNFGARHIGPNHQNVAPTVRLRVAVGAGMNQLTRVSLAPWPVREVRVVVVAGRDDHEACL